MFDKILIMDGGTGEELFSRGLPDDRETWSSQAVWNSKYHLLLRQIHIDMIKAGAKTIVTNNFAITKKTFFHNGGNEKVRELTQVAAQIAVDARDSISNKENVRVLGSLPPLNGCYRSDLVLPEKECNEQYEVILRALAPFVDGIICETISSISEMKFAISSILKLKKLNHFPIFGSWCLTKNGNLYSGESPNEAITSLLEFCGQRLEVLMFNCSQPEHIFEALSSINSKTMNLLKKYNVKLGACPNLLTEIPEEWEIGGNAQPMRTDLNEEAFLDWCKKFADAGCQYIGGCCGVNSNYISVLKKLQ